LSQMEGQKAEPAAQHANKFNMQEDRKAEEVASYVCDITGDLKKLALDADLTFLAYLIDMVHIEAFNAKNARRMDPKSEKD